MAREVACQMVESFCSKDFQRKKQIIEMLTTFLGDMSHAGEAAQEFVHLYQRLITPDQVSLLLRVCEKISWEESKNVVYMYRYIPLG